VGQKVVLQRVRVKRGIGRAHPSHQIIAPTKKSVVEDSLPDGTLMVKVPGDTNETIAAIAKYEERAKATVVRSLILLGLRVYRQLSDNISPYAPAHQDVTDDEIKQAATDVQDDSAQARAAYAEARAARA
jgi:hypothetical protein